MTSPLARALDALDQLDDAAARVLVAAPAALVALDDARRDLTPTEAAVVLLGAAAAIARVEAGLAAVRAQLVEAATARRCVAAGGTSSG